MDDYPQQLALPFFSQHAINLSRSYGILLEEPLLVPVAAQEGAAPSIYDLFDAPFALLSHGIEKDPVFNFANRKALAVFGYSWEAFTAMPSRLSAEPVAREERQHLLDQVAAKGYIDNYSGVRIASGGRRFKIVKAIVWNLLDEKGQHIGQAAKIDQVGPAV